jgi:prepilin-type N-terminal cleavage/methylation domain-containing protein
LVSRRRRSRQRGFTLVELLISMGLSMVGLLGLMTLQVIAVRGNMSSRNFAEATSLAQERIEWLQSVGYTGIAAQAKTEYLNQPGTLPRVLASAAGAEYTRTTAVVIDASTNTARVSVTVQWPDPDVASKSHSVVLWTAVSP